MDLLAAFEIAQHVARSTTPELRAAEAVLATEVDRNNPDAWFPWGACMGSMRRHTPEGSAQIREVCRELGFFHDRYEEGRRWLIVGSPPH